MLCWEPETKHCATSCALPRKNCRLNQTHSLEADRQLAENQAELAKMWAELGKRSLAAS